MATSRPPVPDDLTPAEKRTLMAWVKENYPRWHTADRLRWVVGETLDYHRGIGNRSRYEDWPAVVRNRIRHIDAKGWDPFQTRLQFEQPRESREESSEPVALADVIEIKRQA